MAPLPDDRLDRARRDAGLSRQQLWLRYFALGGMMSALTLEAMLQGVLLPDPDDGDRVVHALNERFAELGREQRVSYSTQT